MGWDATGPCCRSNPRKGLDPSQNSNTNKQTKLLRPSAKWDKPAGSPQHVKSPHSLSACCLYNIDAEQVFTRTPAVDMSACRGCARSCMPLAIYARNARHPLLRACHRAHIVSGATNNTASAHASNDEARESWDGLLAWRSAAPDARTRWGDKQQPVEPEPQATPSHRDPDEPATAGSLADYARLVLSTRGADDKRQLSHAAWMHYQAGGLPVGCAEPPDRPARPDRPEVRHGRRRRWQRRRLPSSRRAAGALPAPLLHDPHPLLAARAGEAGACGRLAGVPSAAQRCCAAQPCAH